MSSSNRVTLGKDTKTGKDVSMSHGALYKGDKELQAKFYKFIDWYNSYDETSSPRHGLYSIISRRTNSYIYDHPALINLCGTAFTTGDAIFFNKDFFEQLLEHRKIPTPDGVPFKSLEFTHTHELGHIIKMHFSRLKHYSQKEGNIIGDMNINTEILRIFDWKLPKDYTEKYIGFRDVDMEDYGHLSEEAIARKMMIRRNDILQRDGIKVEDATKAQKMNALYEVIGWDNDKDKTKDSKSGDQKGQSQESSGEDSFGNDQSDDSNTDNDDSSDNKKSPHDEHMITNEDLADALTKAGDKDLADALGVSPDMTDEEKAEAIQNAKDKLTNDLAEAQSERRRATARGKSLPGQHVEDALDDSLTIDRKAVINWKLMTQNMVYGNGMEMKPEDSVPNDTYHFPFEEMGLDQPLYLPGDIMYEETKGCYLFIIDTSGSMTLDMIEESIAEIGGVLEGIENEETKVFLVSADTVSRGNVLEINHTNIEEKFKELLLQGRGGTNLTAGIVDSMKLVEEQFPEHPISGIIYGTDLGDTPPKREDLPDNLPELIFITAPECFNTHFAAEVEDFAQVVCIEEGAEAVFTDENDFAPAM